MLSQVYFDFILGITNIPEVWIFLGNRIFPIDDVGIT